jgi:hypothetical protein
MIHPAVGELIHMPKAAALRMLAQHRTPDEHRRRLWTREQKR